MKIRQQLSPGRQGAAVGPPDRRAQLFNNGFDKFKRFCFAVRPLRGTDGWRRATAQRFVSCDTDRRNVKQLICSGISDVVSTYFILSKCYSKKMVCYEDR